MRERRNLKQKFSSLDIWLLRLSMITFKILGLAPFKIVILSNNTKMTFYFVKFVWGKVYNFSLSLYFFFIMFMYLPHMNNSVIWTIPTIQISYEYVFSFYANGIAMMIILIYGITQQSAVLVLNRFIKWNTELTNKLPELQQLHQLQSGRCQQILITVLQIIICIVLVISEFLVGDDPKIYLLPIGFPGLIIECFIIQYSLMVIVLKKKYYDLNEILLSIENSTNKIQNNTIFVTAEPCNQKLIDDLIFVRNSLRLLDDISRDLIGFFSLPILLAIMFMSVQLVYHSYFLSVLFIVPPPQNRGPSRYVNSFTWVIKEVYPTAILTIIITQTVTEVCMNLLIYQFIEIKLTK